MLDDLPVFVAKDNTRIKRICLFSLALFDFCLDFIIDVEYVAYELRHGEHEDDISQEDDGNVINLFHIVVSLKFSTQKSYDCNLSIIIRTNYNASL